MNSGERTIDLHVELLTPEAANQVTRFHMPDGYEALQVSGLQLSAYQGMSVDDFPFAKGDAHTYFLDEQFKLHSITDETYGQKHFSDIRGAVLTSLPIHVTQLNQHRTTLISLDKILNNTQGFAVSFRRGVLYAPRRLRNNAVSQIIYMPKELQ